MQAILVLEVSLVSVARLWWNLSTKPSNTHAAVVFYFFFIDGQPMDRLGFSYYTLCRAFAKCKVYNIFLGNSKKGIKIKRFLLITYFDCPLVLRFVILKFVRRDQISLLPLPKRLRDYLNTAHYYSEQLVNGTTSSHHSPWCFCCLFLVIQIVY